MSLVINPQRSVMVSLSFLSFAMFLQYRFDGNIAKDRKDRCQRMLLLVELYSFHKWFNRNRVPREESTVGICHLHLRSTTNSDRCQRMLLLVELYSWRAINTMKTLLANRVPREESTVGICLKRIMWCLYSAWRLEELTFPFSYSVSSSLTARQS